MFFGKRRGTRRALVLGCGPAGLFAVHALVGQAWDVTVVSKKRRSEMFGAQYLQAPIPGLPSKHREVDFDLWGTWEASTSKTYGAGVLPVQTFEEYIASRGRDAWDIRGAYNLAWDAYAELIRHSEFGTPGGDFDSWFGLSMDLSAWDLVISSLPAKVLCKNPAHIFDQHMVWTIGDAPERGVFCPIPCPANTVIINGTDNAWYRVSNLFGYKTAEWPEGIAPPFEGAVLSANPLRTNCNCYPEIIRVGRFGRWDRTEFTHHAYARAWEAGK